MSEQRLTAISDAEFDALIEGHIERTAAGQSEVPGEVFFDVLLERIAANVGETVTLEVAIEGDQVVLVASGENADVVVEGNAILVGGRRLVLQPSQRAK